MHLAKLTFLYFMVLLFISGPVLAQTKVGILGDIEGNYSRFSDFIKNGDTFFYNSRGELDLLPGRDFVFMGDAIDHGPGAIRFTKAITELKEKYPRRVNIILGNRDLNKMKIYHVLKSLDAGIYIPSEKYVYDFLLHDIHGVSLEHKLGQSEIISLLQKKARPHQRLKSILKGFGAPGGFEFHRDELKILNPKMKTISSSLVYKDYMTALAPGGRMRKLLSFGDLVAIIDGNLFTHGAITQNNHGLVPGHSRNYTNTREWVVKLNKWLHNSIDDWKRDSRFGLSLDKYQKPNTKTMRNIHSVVYGRYSDASGNPKTPKSKFLNKLKKAGIYRIFVGHTPTGDYPILLRHKDFEIVLTDSSHARFNSASSIIVDGKSLSVSTYDPVNKHTILIDSNIHDNNRVVGMHTKTGLRVIGEIQETGEYLLTKVKGEDRVFKTIYTRVGKDRIAANSLVEMSVILAKKHPCAEVTRKIFLKLK